MQCRWGSCEEEVALPDRLLPQPHGFEGLCSISEARDSYHFPVAERGHLEDGGPGVGSACSPHTLELNLDHDAVSPVRDDLHELDSEIGEVPEHLPPHRFYPLASSVGVLLKRGQIGNPLGVRVESPHGGSEFTPIEVVERSPRNLDVLLRHRPPSIPRGVWEGRD
jgi:hypothetical protein